MRWVFYFLIFLNLFFYLWQNAQMTNDQDEINTTYNTNNVPTIELLSERPDIKSKQINTATSTEQSIQHSLTCLYIGGTIHKQQLSVVSPFIEEIKQAMPMEMVSMPAPKYKLTVSYSTDPEKDTIQQKLVDANINFLALHNNEDIHLGIFEDDNTLNELKNQLAKLEIKPINTQELPKTAQSYWIKIPSSHTKEFTSDILENLSAQLSTIQIELMPCNEETAVINN